MAELGLGKEFEDGGGHEVGGRVAKDFEGFGIALGEQAEFDVGVEWAGEIDELWFGLVAIFRGGRGLRGPVRPRMPCSQ